MRVGRVRDPFSITCGVWGPTILSSLVKPDLYFTALDACSFGLHSKPEGLLASSGHLQACAANTNSYHD